MDKLNQNFNALSKIQDNQYWSASTKEGKIYSISKENSNGFSKIKTFSKVLKIAINTLKDNEIDDQFLLKSIQTKTATRYKNFREKMHQLPFYKRFFVWLSWKCFRVDSHFKKLKNLVQNKLEKKPLPDSLLKSTVVNIINKISPPKKSDPITDVDNIINDAAKELSAINEKVKEKVNRISTLRTSIHLKLKKNVPDMRDNVFKKSLNWLKEKFR